MCGHIQTVEAAHLYYDGRTADPATIAKLKEDIARLVGIRKSLLQSADKKHAARSLNQIEPTLDVLREYLTQVE